MEAANTPCTPSSEGGGVLRAGDDDVGGGGGGDDGGGKGGREGDGGAQTRHPVSNYLAVGSMCVVGFIVVVWLFLWRAGYVLYASYILADS